MIWIEIVKDMSADNMTETIALNDKNGKSDHDNDGNKDDGDGVKLKAEMSLLNGCGVIVGCIIGRLDLI